MSARSALGAETDGSTPMASKPISTPFCRSGTISAAVPPLKLLGMLPGLGGPTTLYIVQAAERLIIFYYEVEIDPAIYPAPAAPVELFPGLEARACDGAPNRACYVVTEALAANACADPVFRPLIDRGAIIRYLFRDLNRRPLTDAAIEAVDCGPAQPVAGLP